MNNIAVGGEVISAKTAMGLIALIQHDAMEMAGTYHGMNRSRKFRVNWPNEDVFAQSEWRTFVAAVRQMYSERLGNPKTTPDEAKKMYLALLLERAFSLGQEMRGVEADHRLQLAPNTQQFMGDKAENKKIAETFGDRPNLRARLRAGAAKLKVG